MNCVIPFTKDIKFKTSIGEILSISLEHEYTLNDNEVLGNFIISGEYKTHEVSVNKEPFEYVLPFSVDLTNDFDVDTIDLEILDFSYEVKEPDTLKVNVEFKVNALEVKNEEERLEDLIEELEVEEEPKKDENREVVDENTKDALINNISDKEDVFVTYNIYIMKENDTIENICTKYNTNVELLKEYNDLNNINTGDKILIPLVDE